MEKIKKILFPFFKEKYWFLLGKWWFRLLIVIFIVFVVMVPVVSSLNYHSVNSDWCWQNLQERIRQGDYRDDSSYSVFQDDKDYCVQIAQDASLVSFILYIVTSLFSLYGLQFIFFKIIIDYIVLGTIRPKK